MRFSKNISFVISVGVLFSGFTAVAQTSDPFGNRSQADTSISYKPPAVYVTKILLDPIGQTNKITGKFTVWNNEKELIGGLLYRIDLLDPLPKANLDTGNVEDNSLIYDRFVSTEQFSLAPNEHRDFSFNYNPPNLPAGNYRIEITATNTLGRDMGWWDADLKLNATENNFIKLISGPLLSPEYPDRRFPAQAGPNITPKTNFSINVAALNKGEKDIKVTPVLSLYEFDMARGLLDTIKGNPETISRNASKDISLSITASDVPRVYYGLLELVNTETGKRVSNLNEYRWVVKGKHAEIVSLRVISPATKKDQELMTRIDLVGAADAMTKTTVSLNVAVKDANGTAGEIKTKPTELSDGVKTTQGPIKLTRDLTGNAQLIATLIDTNGKEMNRYVIALTNTTTPFSPTPINRPNTTTAKIGAAIGIILLIGVSVFTLKKYW